MSGAAIVQLIVDGLTEFALLGVLAIGLFLITVFGGR